MAAQEKKFEDELKDLEATVARIDSGELSLEESLKAFEQGVALVSSLNRKLDEVEKKIEVLVRDSQGELRTTPYREIKNEDDDLSS
jgi:exodeoxyribonuclease VII small subunit